MTSPKRKRAPRPAARAPKKGTRKPPSKPPPGPPPAPPDVRTPLGNQSHVAESVLVRFRVTVSLARESTALEPRVELDAGAAEAAESFPGFLITGDPSRAWVAGLLRDNLEAGLDAIGHLLAEGGFDRSVNPLSAAGNLLSRALRRRILLRELRRQEWNLTRTSEALGLGGTGNVLRMIRDLALSGAYEQARADGLVTRAHKPRTRPR